LFIGWQVGASLISAVRNFEEEYKVRAQDPAPAFMGESDTE
jgi:hypothetical protein